MTHDDAIIERVARAICEATSGPFEMLDDVGRDALRHEARAAITAYLSALPERELLREALKREEGVTLVHSTASPAVIDPEKGWQASYDGAIAQGHGDEGARAVANFYWAHPADVAEKRNTERKDRLHLVDMAGLFAEDYVREKLERDAEDDAVRLHKLATDRFEEIIALKAMLREALSALEPFANIAQGDNPQINDTTIKQARAAADKIRAAMGGE